MKLTKKHYLIRGTIFIILGVIMLFMIFYNKDFKEYTKNLFYMDTYINVKIYSNNEEKAKQALDEVDKIYKKYHQLTNRYSSYDNIKNIYYINNVLKNNEKIKIDKELYDIIKYSIDAYEDSNGLFNIALGNAIDVWKKYRDLGTGIPTYAELSNQGSLDITDIKLGDDYTIEKESGVKIDLGAISKGYTTEIIGNYLESIGLRRYIINAGGNVKVGKHYGRGEYKIGIEEPKASSNEIFQVVKGNNISVVTSGGYERFYEYEGKTYHHIIDPKTLYPPMYFDSVTIIAKDSKIADMLSTAVFLMPLADGQKYVNSLKDIEAIWYAHDGKIYYSKGFKKYE